MVFGGDELEAGRGVGHLDDVLPGVVLVELPGIGSRRLVADHLALLVFDDDGFQPRVIARGGVVDIEGDNPRQRRVVDIFAGGGQLPVIDGQNRAALVRGHQLERDLFRLNVRLLLAGVVQLDAGPLLDRVVRADLHHLFFPGEILFVGLLLGGVLHVDPHIFRPAVARTHHEVQVILVGLFGVPVARDAALENVHLKPFVAGERGVDHRCALGVVGLVLDRLRLDPLAADDDRDFNRYIRLKGRLSIRSGIGNYCGEEPLHIFFRQFFFVQDHLLGDLVLCVGVVGRRRGGGHDGQQVLQLDILPVAVGGADRPCDVELRVPILDLFDQPEILGDELERVARVEGDVLAVGHADLFAVLTHTGIHPLGNLVDRGHRRLDSEREGVGNRLAQDERKLGALADDIVGVGRRGQERCCCVPLVIHFKVPGQRPPFIPVLIGNLVFTIGVAVALVLSVGLEEERLVPGFGCDADQLDLELPVRLAQGAHIGYIPEHALLAGDLDPHCHAAGLPVDRLLAPRDP